jgi:hypothetical protein
VTVGRLTASSSACDLLVQSREQAECRGFRGIAVARPVRLPVRAGSAAAEQPPPPAIRSFHAARHPWAVVGPTLTGPLLERSDVWERDFTRGMLAEIEWRETEGDVASGLTIPYPYVMQRLVEELGERARR